MSTMAETVDVKSMSYGNETGSDGQVQIDLPTEIIIYIMEFLPLSDRISASQTSQAWYEASRDRKLHKNEVVVIQDTVTRPLDSLLISTNTFLNFHFKDIELNSKLNSFWDKYCPQIHSLTISQCIVTEKMFVEILSRCHHLESLAINNCRELLMTGRVLETESDVLVLKKILVKLKDLCLCSNRYLSDAIFYRFVSIAPNLQELDLTGCHISFHKGLYKKFYPSFVEDNFLLSESVFTFNVILRYLQEQSCKLQVLKLGNTLVDNPALSQLVKVPGLRLLGLHLQSCKQLSHFGFLYVTEHQTALTHLDLSDCSRATDSTLLAICEHLTNLTTLNLQRCRGISNIGTAKLPLLSKLRCLNLGQCEQVTAPGVCTAPNPTLRSLTLCALLLEEATVLQVAENLMGLTHLDISWCFDAVSDRVVQAICHHLRYLRLFKLAACKMVSDAGITGKGLQSEACPGLSTDTLVDRDEWSDPLHKISLRSRAEREIVEDAKLKNTVSRKCADTQAGSGADGVSLAVLQGLQHLDVSGCNRITDVGLQYAVRFRELRHLDISQCQQVTHQGLAALASSNPSMEVLIMNHCYNITDDAVIVAVKNLTRLRHLNLQGCKLLTDTTLEAIGTHCSRLQYLNVNQCSGMSQVAAERLEQMLPGLRTVHRSGLQLDLSPNTSDLCFPPPPPTLPHPGSFIFRR